MKRKIGLALSQELVDLIDENRGLISRSAFVENKLRATMVAPDLTDLFGPVSGHQPHLGAK